jgi:hypothetical protein
MCEISEFCMNVHDAYEQTKERHEPYPLWVDKKGEKRTRGGGGEAIHRSVATKTL